MHSYIVSNPWTGYILKIELWTWKIVIESLSKLNWISQIYEQIIHSRFRRQALSLVLD